MFKFKKKPKFKFLVPKDDGKALDKKKGGLKKSRFGWKTIGRILVLLFLVFLFGVAATFAYFSKDLPTPNKLKNISVQESTQILDRNGGLLYQVHGDQRRTVLKSEEIPDLMKKATISVEDKDFYKHHGVNFSSIARAALANITHRSISQGASTITQQLVKNTLLTSKRTFSRKVKEVILSVEMERIYSKDEILTLYLNYVPFGSNAYGVEAASEIYFAKPAKDLTLPETATLAALLRAPSYYSPYGNNREALANRTEFALNQMYDQGYIKKDDRDKAIAVIKNKEIKFARLHENIKAPHFVFYVLEKLGDKYDQKYIEEGGLKVYTTIDPTKQQIAEEAVTAGVKKNLAAGYNATNAALVSIDPKTGEVLAMVGGADYFDIEHDGNVNVANRPRQPGSSFKPVVYSTLFKTADWKPGSTLFDVKTDFGGGYTPNNYDKKFRGPVTVRQALSNSLNVPAVKALALSSIKSSLQTARDMGITTLTDPDRYGLSLVLGGGEVKLSELTEAYTTFAGAGQRQSMKTILKIEDSSGKVIDENPPVKPIQVLDPQNAYEISSILSDNGTRKLVFGYNPALDSPNRPLAVKTGTTDDFRDGWTIGYTPSLVAGVWAGNNNNHPIGQGADGSRIAAPIWREYMDKALGNSPVEQFARPAGIQDLAIDRFTGKLPGGGETVTDIIAAWQVPKERGSAYYTVRVDKLTGNKATDNCPDQYVEIRRVANIHSERPTDSNWENPVLAWAASAGYSGASVKTPATCAALDNANKPKISISSPANGSNQSGTKTVSASVSAPLGVASITFYLDNDVIKTGAATSASYNFASVSLGSHAIKVVVKDNSGQEASASISIMVVTTDIKPPTNSSP